MWIYIKGIINQNLKFNLLSISLSLSVCVTYVVLIFEILQMYNLKFLSFNKKY